MINLKFYKNREKKITKLYNLTKILTLTLIITTIFFVNHLLSQEFKSARKFMEQSVIQTASNIKGRRTNYINELKILSVKMKSSCYNFSRKEVITFLRNNIDNFEYQKLVFVYKDGEIISTEKEDTVIPSDDLKKNKNLKGIMNNELIFSNTLQDKNLSSGYVSEYGVPVYNRKNDLIGYIASQNDAQTYVRILGLNNYNKQGISYIIDEKGNYLIKPLRDKSTIKNFFDNNLKYSETTEEKVLELLKDKTYGSFVFAKNREKYIGAFAKIGDTEKYVLTILPLHVLMLHVNKLMAILTILIFLISLLMLALSYLSNLIFKQNEKLIYDMAFTDEITGEGNKNKFILQARDLIDKDTTRQYAIISVDITKFKAINELYGINRADDILKDIYQILKKHTGNNGLCVRDHAATFDILYNYDNTDSIINNLINKILEDISEYNKTGMKHIAYDYESVKTAKLSLSFGIYLITDKSLLIDSMCEKAYIAKRSIKEDAINLYKFYDDKIREQILQDKEIEDEMYPALHNNQFKMYLQPKFDLKTNTLSGAEALVRWIHPEKGLIPPMNFIPLFENNGFIIELDKCVWEQACEFLACRKKKGLKLFHISVNVSKIHLNNDSFISELVNLTKKYDIEPEYLELELTETACFNNENRFKEVLNRLKELGFTISMDDFGTGYSSLNMLRHLPVDILKLDRGFIKDTLNEDRGKIVVNCMIDLATKLNMVTVAEGIETEEQAGILKEAGCHIAQGFLYGKPMDTDSFVKTFLEQESNV